MFPYRSKRTGRSPLHECMRQDAKEVLFFKLYAQNDLSYSKFKEVWRGGQFGVLQLVCPGQANRDQYMQVLYAVFLGFVNDPYLLYRDYKDKNAFADDANDDDDDGARVGEDDLEDDNLADSVILPRPTMPINDVQEPKLVESLLNIGVIYGLYSAYKTQVVAEDQVGRVHSKAGASSANSGTDSDSDSDSDSDPDSMVPRAAESGRQPIRISIEKWTELVVATQQLECTGQIGIQAQRMMKQLVKDDAFQIAVYSGPIGIENCVVEAREMMVESSLSSLKRVARGTLGVVDAAAAAAALALFKNADEDRRSSASILYVMSKG